MINNFKDKFQLLFEKIKKIKHFYIYLAVIIAILFVGVYYISIPKDNKEEITINDNIPSEFSTSSEYVGYLENKLKNVIGALKGVGNVEVVVTLEKGFEYIYQTEEETRTTSNGTSITTSTIILVDGQPIMLKETYPTIKGVVVVAEGSSNTSTKMDILYLIQTIIDLDASKINIIEGK